MYTEMTGDYTEMLPQTKARTASRRWKTQEVSSKGGVSQAYQHLEFRILASIDNRK